MNAATFNTSTLQLSNIDGLTLQFAGSSAALTLSTSGYTIVSPSGSKGTAKIDLDGVLQICASTQTYGSRYNVLMASSSVEKTMADISEFAGKTFYEMAKCQKPTANTTTNSWLKINSDGSAIYYDATKTTPAQETVPASSVAAAFSSTGDGNPTTWMRMYKITVSSGSYYVIIEADYTSATNVYGSMWVEAALIR